VWYEPAAKQPQSEAQQTNVPTSQSRQTLLIGQKKDDPFESSFINLLGLWIKTANRRRRLSYQSPEPEMKLHER
jgi:hypothetical protein